MSDTGRSKVGHLHRDRNDQTSRSYCGRSLTTEGFTDASAKPSICKRCLAATCKVVDPDHHHLAFEDGRWIVHFILRPTWFSIVGGGTITSAASQCPFRGCDRMVQGRIQPAIVNTGSCADTTFAWAA